MNTVRQTTNKHVKAALDDLCAAGISPENLMEYVHSMTQGIGFMLGAIKQTSPEVFSDSVLDELVNEIGSEMKRIAQIASTFQPPKPN